MIKKCAMGLPSSFEKRKKSFREDGGQKITVSSQGFEWINKMNIYKFKLGFWGLSLDVLKGQWANPHQIMIFWALKMKF